jgi:signal transduction histidine kinase
MSPHPSLSWRLAGALVIAQIVMILITLQGVVLIPAVIGLISGSAQVDEFAVLRTRELLTQSIVRRADGSAAIAPSPAMRAYLAGDTAFRFAALDPKTRRPIAGSSPELMKSLSHFDHIDIDVTKFTIVGDTGAHRYGNMHKGDTPAGELVLIIYGYAASVDDLSYLLKANIETFATPGAIAVLSPLIMATLGIGLIVARRSLWPLQRAVVSAKGIELNSLDQRLPTNEVPIEVLPLVEAVNDALARVDLGVARQRRFLANAAHELRTPVAVLNARLDSPRKPSFEIDLKRDVRRIRNIIEQLLVASRLGEAPDEESSEFDLVEVAQRQIADHTLVAIKSDRQIEFEAPAEPILVKGNRRALESVIANLVDNALHAEPEGGTIIVRLDPEATQLSVIDHGEGVAEPDRALVFEPFWRKSEKREGAGLGLAIVKEIVERHRGCIVVRDTPGGGATFELSLPGVRH